MKALSILLASALIGAASVADAAPVTWSVTGNAYLSGNFTYDAATNTYSDFNIVSTGVVAAGIDYSQAIVAYIPISSTEYQPVYGPTNPVGDATSVMVTGTESQLELRFDAPLTSLQSVSLLNTSVEHFCGTWGCYPPDGFSWQEYPATAMLGGGMFTPTAVPVPAPFALLASGLIGMVAVSAQGKRRDMRFRSR